MSKGGEERHGKHRKGDNEEREYRDRNAIRKTQKEKDWRRRKMTPTRKVEGFELGGGGRRTKKKAGVEEKGVGSKGGRKD